MAEDGPGARRPLPGDRDSPSRSDHAGHTVDDSSSQEYPRSQHWHTANETHTVQSGTFIIECGGKRAELGPNSFNYVPSKMAHEAWTKPEEGALLFITVDGAWDINWVGGPPKPEDFTPRTNR